MEENKQEESKEITLPDIVDLKKKLKRLDSAWAKLLSARMHKEDDKINETMMYTIINNKVKNQRYRILFVKHGVELHKELAAKQASAKKQLKEIK